MKLVQNILLITLFTATIFAQVTVSATSVTGDCSETVSIEIHLENPDVVGGVQFDMFDTPNYLDVIDFSTTNRSADFSIDFNELESGGTRLIMYDAGNGNIDAGTGAVLNMEMIIHDDAYNSNVGINFENVIITNESGSPFSVIGNDSGTVSISPGYIEEPHNLVAQDGMDEQVLLNWDPPVGPIFSLPFEITILTDNYPTETSWNLSTSAGEVIAEIIAGDLTTGGETYSWEVELLSGNDYVFTINDSWGDGICCGYGYGEYNLYLDDELIHTGGEFAESETVEFSTSGRLSIIRRSYLESLPANKDLNYNTILSSDRSVGEPVVVNVGSFNLNNPVENNELRPVDINAYKVYRSYNEDSGFEEIAEVDGNTTTYLDEDLVNSTSYFYKVTAIYPDGSESQATNTVSATPVEWVEIWMDDGSSLSGQTDTIDFYINNDSELALFYFEVVDYPNVLNSMNILPTDRTADWALEIVDQGDGSIAITGLAIMTPLYSGDGPVCRAILYPVASEEMTVNLSFSSGTSIQDINYIELNWTAENASYDVGIETQYGHLTGGFVEPGDVFMSSLILANTQPVYGIQLDIVSDPPFLSGVGMAVSELHDFSSWEMVSEDMGDGVMRIIMHDNPNMMSSPIEPGISHVVDVMFDAFNVASGTEVELSIANAAISDINSLPMYTEGISADVYIGTPPAAYTIQNVTGALEPNGSGSFEVHVENTEMIGIVSFTLVDLPQSMTVTNIVGVNRFDDVIIDNSYGENEDGTFSFFGFDPITGLEPGSGSILELDVEFDNNLNNSSIILTMPTLATADASANPIMSVFHGFGQFTGYLSADDEIVLPEEFALHPNFPNPFNPKTVISYDLSEAINVRLEIYDLMGRMINLLVNQNQNPGRHFVTWNANDFFGEKVSAGVYLYRLQVGNKSFAKKMILMK